MLPDGRGLLAAGIPAGLRPHRVHLTAVAGFLWKHTVHSQDPGCPPACEEGDEDGSDPPWCGEGVDPPCPCPCADGMNVSAGGGSGGGLNGCAHECSEGAGLAEGAELDAGAGVKSMPRPHTLHFDAPAMFFCVHNLQYHGAAIRAANRFQG